MKHYNCNFDFSTGLAPTSARRKLRSLLETNSSCRQESRQSWNRRQTYRFERNFIFKSCLFTNAIYVALSFSRIVCTRNMFVNPSICLDQRKDENEGGQQNQLRIPVQVKIRLTSATFYDLSFRQQHFQESKVKDLTIIQCLHKNFDSYEMKIVSNQSKLSFF